MAFARSPASTGRGWYVFPASSAPRRAARIVDVRGGLSRGFFGRSGARRSGTGADSTDARGASAPAGQRRHIAAPLSATEAARARWRCRRYVGMGASSRGRPWTGRSLQRRPPSRHCHEALLAVRRVASHEAVRLVGDVARRGTGRSHCGPRSSLKASTAGCWRRPRGNSTASTSTGYEKLNPQIEQLAAQAVGRPRLPRRTHSTGTPRAEAATRRPRQEELRSRRGGRRGLRRDVRARRPVPERRAPWCNFRLPLTTAMIRDTRNCNGYDLPTAQQQHRTKFKCRSLGHHAANWVPFRQDERSSIAAPSPHVIRIVWRLGP